MIDLTLNRLAKNDREMDTDCVMKCATDTHANDAIESVMSYASKVEEEKKIGSSYVQRNAFHLRRNDIFSSNQLTNGTIQLLN